MRKLALIAALGAFAFPAAAQQITTPVSVSIAPLVIDNANSVSQRNGANAQGFHVYNNFADSLDGEWADIAWSGNVLSVGTNANGTGVTRGMQFIVGGVAVANFSTARDLLWNSDNAHDIGASGANRPRSIFAGTNISAGSNISLTGANGKVTATYIQVTSGTGNAGYLFGTTGTFQSALDGNFTWNNNATTNSFTLTAACVTATPCVQVGASNSATPIAQVIQGQGSRAGTDTNVAGGNLTIAAGQGTGNPAGSSLILQAPLAVGSGSGAQTMTTVQTITAAGGTVSALPFTGSAFIPNGSAPTPTGTCTHGAQVGANTAGSVVLTCTAQTIILTFATTAPHGWICAFYDQTTTADTVKQTSNGTGSCTGTGTTAASDVVLFTATPF